MWRKKLLQLHNFFHVCVSEWLKNCMCKKGKLVVIKNVLAYMCDNRIDYHLHICVLWANWAMVLLLYVLHKHHCCTPLDTKFNPLILNSTLAWCCPWWDCDPRWSYRSYVDVWLQPGGPRFHRGHAPRGNYGGVVPRLPQLWEDQWLPTTWSLQLVSQRNLHQLELSRAHTPCAACRAAAVSDQDIVRDAVSHNPRTTFTYLPEL